MPSKHATPLVVLAPGEPRRAQRLLAGAEPWGEEPALMTGPAPGRPVAGSVQGALGLPRIQWPPQRLKMASGPEAPVGLVARGLGPSPAVFLQWQESPGKDKQMPHTP